MSAAAGWGKIPAAAAYAGVCVRTVRHWMKGGLRHSRLPSGAVLIRYADIDAFLEQFATSADESDKLLDKIVAELE